MRAAHYEDFREPITIKEVADPTVFDDGVVVRVKATGICHSDWHGWMGHDPDIIPPHVPGHELAGVVEEVGRDVRRWAAGDRVTVPFVSGCGRCPPCLSGDPQICDDQFQPGFAMIAAGTLDPQRLVEQTVTMEEGLEILTAMDGYHLSGVTVIDRL